MYSMFHLLMNRLHKIVILYFFGLGLILRISPINNHIKIELAISLHNLKLWVICVHWISEMSNNNASFSLILYEFNFCVHAGYVAPHIIVQYKNSACTKAWSSFKEMFVLAYLEFNLSKLQFISI